MQFFLKIGEFAERPGIEIARLGSNLAARPLDLNFDLMETAILTLFNRVAQHIVIPGHGPDLVEILSVHFDI